MKVSYKVRPSPTSPAIAVSTYGVTIGLLKFPLQLRIGNFLREFQPEFVEQDLLVIGWTPNTAFTDFNSLARRENHVHQTNVGQLIEYTSWLVTQASGLAD